ncbi:efflux RND transporter periplasmic adaptor subunit [Methylomonas sp. SURF-1]|uniref:Efflux RND transporter periplasmic adaptor subunit n=1 Tax=Methylomonas aurea TaxID=2952224 RepID=A0ABT1UHH7_9GAMM|nr:efflux RND transporter periplasmic adaptor subunit [Methylomonas sp. SURF-1]MCQ8181645.1 efflux RND transporter periplasmic adaptor subunit [Methylomonas sp. SURF-1]
MKTQPSHAFELPKTANAGATLKQTKRAGLVLLGLLLSGAALRLAANQRHDVQLQQTTAEALQRNVIVARPRVGDSARKLTLPATLRGYTETQIFARANGYLKKWHKTIGDTVKQGDLLAEIDVPELEHELAQGRATLAQVKAKAELARTTLQRWSQLNETDGAPLQEFEEKRAAFMQAEADVAATVANVKRLENIEGYRRVVAPFNGVITRRSVDVGALISAGTQELFALTQTDPLRLNVWVPQAYADEIKTGQSVSVRLPDKEDSKPLNARVERVAGALDTATRSRQAEIVLANNDAKLLPGSYVEISISVPSKAPALVAPANTLVIDQAGTHVVVVGNDKKIGFKPVKLGRDLGKEVEIVDGLSADDLLVASPSDLLIEGETVGIVETAPKTAEKAEPATKKPS